MESVSKPVVYSINNNSQLEDNCETHKQIQKFRSHGNKGNTYLTHHIFFSHVF